MKQCLAAKRLKNRTNKIDSENGMALVNIYKIGLDDSIIQDVKACLQSENYLDVSIGLYFLIGLLYKYKLKDFYEDFTNYLINRMPELIDNNQGGQARYFALDLFIWLRRNYPNYRSKMFELLKSNDSECRCRALLNYETFSQKYEISPLLTFENDDYVAELSMCGPLVYELRNLALTKISDLAKINFCQGVRQEFHKKWNDNVSWFSWGLFLDWWKDNKI